MVTIDYTGLRLTGALRINRLTALELHVGVNEHGWAIVEGEAGENAWSCSRALWPAGSRSSWCGMKPARSSPCSPV